VRALTPVANGGANLKVQPISIHWNPGLPIYAAESFLKAVGSEYGWLGGIDRSGTLRCILPFTIIDKGPVRIVRFRVQTISIEEDLTLDEEKSFLNDVVEFFRSIGADMIVPATTNSIFRTFPDGAIVAPYGTFIIDLVQTEEALLTNLHSSHRRKLRLATKQGVQIHSGIDYINVAYKLIRETFRRSKMGFMDFQSFSRYVFSLGENVKILVADYQGIVQACVVVPFSNFSAYYVYGGSISEPVPGATNLLHWETMLLFRGLGVKRYDLVGVRIDPEKGSKQEGLMRYKQGFGGELVQGYMWKYAIRPLTYMAYSLAVRLLRGGDIVDKERHKLGSV
jgi:hypothetical protein